MWVQRISTFAFSYHQLATQTSIIWSSHSFLNFETMKLGSFFTETYWFFGKISMPKIMIWSHLITCYTFPHPGQPRTKGSAIQTLVLIVVAFVLCYLAYWTVALEQLLEIIGVVRCNWLFFLFGGENHFSHHYIYLLPSVILLFLNCILNPFVYYFQGSRFKGVFPWNKSTRERCSIVPDDRSIKKKVTYTDVVVQFSLNPQTVTSCLWVEGGQRLSLTGKIQQLTAQRTRSKKLKELEQRRSAEEAIYQIANGPTCSVVDHDKDRVEFLQRLKSSGEIDIVERDCSLPAQQTFPRTSKHANKKMRNRCVPQYPRPRSLRLRVDPFVPHERGGSEPYPSKFLNEKNTTQEKTPAVTTPASPSSFQRKIERPQSSPPERIRHSLPAASPPSVSLRRNQSSPVLGQSETPQNNRKLSLVVLQPGELKLTPERSPGNTPNPTTPATLPTPFVMPYKRNGTSTTPAPSSKPLNKTKSSNKLDKRKPCTNSKGNSSAKRGRSRPRGKPMKLTAVIVEDPRRSLEVCPEAKEEQCVIFNPNDLKMSRFWQVFCVLWVLLSSFGTIWSHLTYARLCKCNCFTVL